MIKFTIEKFVEETLEVLRIICGGAAIATLFQEQFHGIIVFIGSYIVILILSSLKGD